MSSPMEISARNDRREWTYGDIGIQISLVGASIVTPFLNVNPYVKVALASLILTAEVCNDLKHRSFKQMIDDNLNGIGFTHLLVPFALSIAMASSLEP